MEKNQQLQSVQSVQPVQPQNSLGNELYSGAADFGRIYAWVSAIIANIIAIGMIIFGIYIIQHKNHLVSVDGQVTKASYDCSQDTENQDVYTTCSFDVSYQVSNQSYTKTFSSTKTFSVGDTVTVWYDPNHPDQAEFDPAPIGIGWALIIGAVLLIISSWFWVWMTRRSKFAAAAGGTIGVINMIRRI